MNNWVVLLIWLLIPSTGLAAVGEITELKGTPASVERKAKQISGTQGTGIEMYDQVTTAKSRLAITFSDDTKVQLTEQSKLVIDEFVYDPVTDVGKASLKVALGTVRYASGKIAHKNRKNIDIRTPTATIAVRGTDFTMTVDEIGRSTVVLLPTCPADGTPCWVGEIEVSTAAGQVILNQANQATVVNSSNSPPSEPKVIDLDESLIDNMLIVVPPKELVDNQNKVKPGTELSLEQDFLEYRELERNYLEDDLFAAADEFSVDLLRNEYLINLLDFSNQLDQDNLSSNFLDNSSPLPNISEFVWVQHYYNESEIFLLSETPPHRAQIKLQRSGDGTVTTIQNDITASIQLNTGTGSVKININQQQ